MIDPFSIDVFNKHGERLVYCYLGSCPEHRIRHEYRTLAAAKIGDWLPGYCITCRYEGRHSPIRLTFRSALWLMGRDVPQYGYSIGCQAPQYIQRLTRDVNANTIRS